MHIKLQRILGNWLISFLTPLLGGGLAFNLPIEPEWLKVVITALIASSIVTGLVVANHLQGAKK